jgi:hypothetical protein
MSASLPSEYSSERGRALLSDRDGPSAVLQEISALSALPLAHMNETAERTCLRRALAYVILDVSGAIPVGASSDDMGGTMCSS